MPKKIKIVLLLLLTLFLTKDAFANSYFIVAPGVLHLNVSKRRPIESFIVRNTGKSKIRLRLAPIYYSINSKSMKMGIPLNNKIVDDISKNLMISPRILSLRPGQKRTVRVAYRKKAKLAPGDYRAHVLIRSVDPIKQKVKPDSSSKGISLNLEIKLQTAIAVYVHSGKSNASLDFTVDKDKLGHILITAKNSTKFKYDGWFQIIQNNNKSKIERFMIFRESTRAFAIKDNKMESLTVKWGAKKTALKYEKNFKLN